MPTVTAILNMDEAIKKAYEFYLKHPKETLIIVTADHETGGIGLGHTYKINWEVFENSWIERGYTNDLNADDNKELNEKGLIRWTTGDQTGAAVPVFAIGKGAEKFSGKYDNTEIKGKILGK